MADIAPSLALAFEMQQALRNGETPRSGAQRFSEQNRSPFADSVRRILFLWDQGSDSRNEFMQMRSPYRRALCDALLRSLQGQSIQKRLEELEEEIELACELELRKHIDLLPLRSMLPVLFLQFPAFLILLFGPLLNQLVGEISR